MISITIKTWERTHTSISYFSRTMRPALNGTTPTWPPVTWPEKSPMDTFNDGAPRPGTATWCLSGKSPWTKATGASSKGAGISPTTPFWQGGRIQDHGFRRHGYQLCGHQLQLCRPQRLDRGHVILIRQSQGLCDRHLYGRQICRNRPTAPGLRSQVRPVTYTPNGGISRTNHQISPKPRQPIILMTHRPSLWPPT